jgi:hypothetical protein
MEQVPATHKRGTDLIDQIVAQMNPVEARADIRVSHFDT